MNGLRSIGRLWCLLGASLILLGVLFSSVAQAQTLTNSTVRGEFTCQNGSPQGQLLTTGGNCPNSPEDGKIFSYFVCKFEEILNDILSKVYCAVMDGSTASISAALTLLVVLTGAAFLMGVLPFTAKELMMLAAKFSLVLAFALNAEYMIGIGYNFFINASKEGIVIVLDYLVRDTEIAKDMENNNVYSIFDNILQNFIGLVTQNDGTAQEQPCKDSIFTMIIVMAAAVPPLAFVGVYFVMRIIWMCLRAVFGYCQGLLGVTFLVTLAPIFVSFALFKPTRVMFDKWIQYLISFSFQMVIVFAFLGMVFFVLDEISDDLGEFQNLVRPYKQDYAHAPGVFQMFDTCGICEMAEASATEPPSCKGGEDAPALPLAEMTKNEEFLKFATVKVLAILLILYVLDMMLDFVPQMAVHLAGPKYAAQLGGGAQTNVPVPGVQSVNSILSAGARGFMDSGNSVSGLINGFRGAAAQALTGEQGLVDTAIRSVANPTDPHRDLSQADSSPAGQLFGAAGGLVAGLGLYRHFSGGGQGATVPRSMPRNTQAGAPGSSAGYSNDDLPDRPAAATAAAERRRREEAESERRRAEGVVQQDAGTTAGGRTGGNPALAAAFERALMEVSRMANPTQQDIELALSRVPSGTEQDKRRALAEIDRNNLHPQVAEFLSSYLSLG